jgi:hypothetical protein
MATRILKSSISSHGINVSKNQFHNEINFAQEIDSMESMPGVLTSLKIRALDMRSDSEDREDKDIEDGGGEGSRIRRGRRGRPLEEQETAEVNEDKGDVK